VKWHVTSYNSADYCFFQAKKITIDHPERSRGSSRPAEHLLFLVDLPTAGVSVVRTPAYSHTISHHHPIVAFTDVRVPAANLVGAEGGGMLYSREWFRFERLMVAARCTGAAERSMLYETARAIDRDPSDTKTAHAQCSMVKLFCSEMAGRVADRTVQIFGGRGYLRENVAERFYRELRVERIWEGASEIQRMIIAGQLTRRGPSALA